MRKAACLILMLLLVIGAALAQEADPEATPAEETPEAEPLLPPAAPETRQKPIANQIELTCPIDGEKVVGWEIVAFATIGVDTDFCYLGASQSYYQKLISTCPSCGYTGYREDFPPHLTKLPEKVVEKIKKKIPKMFDLSKLEPWERYAILAQVYIWRGMPEKEIGNAYLRATYTMRSLTLGRFELRREHELRALAIKYLGKAARKAQFELSAVSQVKYLIGELYRRNGLFKKAIRNFEDAAKIRNRPEWLDELIIRQTARANAYDDS